MYFSGFQFRTNNCQCSFTSVLKRDFRCWQTLSVQTFCRILIHVFFFKVHVSYKHLWLAPFKKKVQHERQNGNKLKYEQSILYPPVRMTSWSPAYLIYTLWLTVMSCSVVSQYRKRRSLVAITWPKKPEDNQSESHWDSWKTIRKHTRRGEL